jgi:hypothetical protein
MVELVEVLVEELLSMKVEQEKLVSDKLTHLRELVVSHSLVRVVMEYEELQTEVILETMELLQVLVVVGQLVETRLLVLLEASVPMVQFILLSTSKEKNYDFMHS